MKRKDLILVGTLLGVLVLLLLVFLYVMSPQQKVVDTISEKSNTVDTRSAKTGRQQSKQNSKHTAYADKKAKKKGRMPANTGLRLKGVDIAPEVKAIGGAPVADAPPKIGARMTMLPGGKKGVVLQVSLISQPRCMEGDLDIIRRDLHGSSSPNLLMALEPLGSDAGGLSSFDSLTKKIPLSKLAPGANFTFSIPQQQAPTHLGLYICKDSLGTGVCRTKKIVDLSRLYDPLYRKKMKRKKGEEAEDKIYFFQYFLLEGNSLTAFDGEMELSNYSQLQSYLSNRLGDAQEAFAVTNQVRELNDFIGSLNAEISRRRIRINLPRYDRSECAKEGIVLPLEDLKRLNKAGKDAR